MNTKPRNLTQFQIDKINEGLITSHQRNFRHRANGKIGSKNDQDKYIEKSIEELKRELFIVKKELSVAMGSSNVKPYNENFNKAKLQIVCSEEIDMVIELNKTYIQQLQSQISRVNRETTKFSKTCMNEREYITKYRKAKLALETAENQKIVLKRKESKIQIDNDKLHEEIENLVFERKMFNKAWQKTLMKLALDKRFFVDLIERAIYATVNATDLLTKLNAAHEDTKLKRDQRILEMRDIVKKLDDDKKLKIFLTSKGKRRVMAEIEPREIKRREMYMEDTQSKITLYANVIKEMIKFYDVDDIHNAIQEFNSKEAEFFSHLNYMNSVNSKIVTMTHLADENYNAIESLKEFNERKEAQEKLKIEEMRDQLRNEKSLTLQASQENKKYKEYIENLLKTIQEMFKIMNCDETPLLELLGDFTIVTEFNVKHFLTILENRLNDIMSCVYFSERLNENGVFQPQEFLQANNSYTIREFKGKFDEPTSIEKLVFVQQCADCGEADNKNVDGTQYPLERNEIIKLIKQKVPTPAMQFKLHSNSKCQLPKFKKN